MYTNKRIAFILYNYPLGVSSMIINSIRMLVRRGYKIDVYIDFEKIFTYISTTDYSEQIISYTNKRKKRGVLRIGFVNVDSKDPYPRYLYLKSVTINFIGSSHE